MVLFVLWELKSVPLSNQYGKTVLECVGPVGMKCSSEPQLPSVSKRRHNRMFRARAMNPWWCQQHYCTEQLFGGQPLFVLVTERAKQKGRVTRENGGRVYETDCDDINGRKNNVMFTPSESSTWTEICIRKYNPPFPEYTSVKKL
jgi:hypothetical protein